MSTKIGTHAVVVGAGIGGMAAAAALSPHFGQVTIVDRDDLPSGGEARKGVPQGRHLHVLLAGGQRALGSVLPGFEDKLVAAGAVPMRVGLDLRVESPRFDPFPTRDLRFVAYAASRPQIEAVVRDAARTLSNVHFRKATAQSLIAGQDGQPGQPGQPGQSVVGVKLKTPEGPVEELPSELVIDASGAGELTLSALGKLGFEPPRITRIGVDIAYSTGVFRVPDDAPTDWRGVMTFPIPPDSRGGLLMPLEGGRWILSIGGRPGQHPPGDWQGFMDVLASMRTRTFHDAVKNAERIGEVQRFRFPESRHRHYEELARFPRGLLPLGDSICRFNPIYGQGMSVAAQEAAALGELLSALARDGQGLAQLSAPFFARTAELIETPWAMAAIPDFIYPQTQGEPPPDLQNMLKFGMALDVLAARDPDVHLLQMEVSHLLKPRSAYQHPKLIEGILGVLAEEAPA